MLLAFWSGQLDLSYRASKAQVRSLRCSQRVSFRPDF
jgi:hypothetical protein